MDIADLLLWCSREDIEEVTDNLKFFWVFRVSFEVGFLEFVMG